MLAFYIIIIGCCLSTHHLISLFSLFPQISSPSCIPFFSQWHNHTHRHPNKAHQNCLGLSHRPHPPTFTWLPSLTESFSKLSHHPHISLWLPSLWLFQVYLTCLPSFGLSPLLHPLSKQFSTAITYLVFFLTQRPNYITSLLKNLKQYIVTYRIKHKIFHLEFKILHQLPLYCNPSFISHLTPNQCPVP